MHVRKFHRNVKLPRPFVEMTICVLLFAILKLGAHGRRVLVQYFFLDNGKKIQYIYMVYNECFGSWAKS